VLVPAARQKIVSTAEENGIPWKACYAWLEQQDGPWRDEEEELDYEVPDYYRRSFHAYERGNLCWEAALEVEIASAAVGARNFPKEGVHGERAFRNSFGAALQESGAAVPGGGTIVDLGCGTGMSTRWLARHYPAASKILGIDLSPYFVHAGQRLLELAPTARPEMGGTGTWVTDIQRDPRIEYRTGDAANTDLPDTSVDVVNLQFVAHELPSAVTMDILREADRILKPTGQLWFCEMDFEAPAYAAQRANALQFSLIRSTEPYLDDYADHSVEFRRCLQETFDETIIAAATGRHFAIVAIKKKEQSPVDKGELGVLRDLRFDDAGNYQVEDTHLKTWENKLRV
jgi:ubiquinone/menaquinone biosynthesis C-methylase UbiE